MINHSSVGLVSIAHIVNAHMHLLASARLVWTVIAPH